MRSTTKTLPIPAPLRYVGVAAMFALCGYWSAAWFIASSFPYRLGWMAFGLPIPFAVLCVLLFVRTAWGALLIPLMDAAWYLAYCGAVLTDERIRGNGSPLSACAGGLVGGIGVMLSAAIFRRSLLSIKHLILLAVIGGISALPLGLCMSAVVPIWPQTIWRGFAIWQAAVGTYLYVICSRRSP